MIFSPEQIQEVLETIHQQHVLFIMENVGKDVLTRDDIGLLRKYGVNVEEIGKGFTPYERAYYFGILSEVLGDSNSKDLKYGDFKKYLQYGQYLPLTAKEEDTLRAIKTQSYANIKNLGSRISNDISNVIAEQESISRGKYETIIREESERMVRDRSSINEMVSNIGHRTKDWGRDLGRLAETEMHNVFEEGRASSLERKGGKDAKVYKDVYPGACRHCIRLYLTAGIGSKPIIFKLSELRSNGNNIGKKVNEWKAIIGATHPWCFVNPSTPVYTMDGYKWICNLKVGDKVLTHRGHFRKIVKLMFREEYKKVIECYYNIEMKVKKKIILIKQVTGGHPFWSEGSWIEAKDLKVNQNLKMLKLDCSGKVPLCHFVNVAIDSIEKVTWDTQKENYDTEKVTLYNIAVEKDESYIVNGIVVHNCRCTLHEKREGYEWEEETRGFTKLKPFVRKVERRSKIRIKVGEKEYVV